MNWRIKFEYGQSTGELMIKTEYGPAFLRIRQIDDNTWAFRNGTISLVNGKWIGGIEIDFHRFYIKDSEKTDERDSGPLVRKSGGITNMDPYTYRKIGDKVVFRLWENKTHTLENISEFFDYRGVVYRVSGGERGTITPIKGTIHMKSSEDENED